MKTALLDRVGRGFTLTEAIAGLISVGILLFLTFAIIMPGLAPEPLANRAVCSANVRGIIQAMVVYAQSNHGQFPAVRPLAPGIFINGVDTTRKWGHQTAGDIIKGYYRADGKATQRGSPLACMWVLVMQNAITPKSFICPSDQVATEPSMAYQTTDSSTDAASCFGNFGYTSQ